MLLHFFCPQCKSLVPPLGVQQRCAGCGSVLVARYDYRAIGAKLAKDDLNSRAQSIWRYQELLPVMDETSIVSLGEGLSPIIPLRQLGKNLNSAQLFMKDDSVMPLGSFRSRLASVIISKAKEEMVQTVVARAGQLEAFAIAAYAARADINAVLLVRRDALGEACEQNILSTGASLYTYEHSEAEALQKVEKSALAHGWLNASAFHDPYRLEGAKTIGFEIAEIFEWQLPDVIILPALGGTLLAGIYRAMRDLIALGWVANKLPRLVAVQSETVNPLVDAWEAKKLGLPIEEREGGEIGFNEKVDFINQSAYLALDAVYKSLGKVLAVSPEDVLHARLLLAEKEGTIASAAGASTLAAGLKLDAEGWIKRGERVLLYNPEGSLISAGPGIGGGIATPVDESFLGK